MSLVPFDPVLVLCRITCAGLILAWVLCGISQAGDWEPPPPLPDEYDWIQLDSGEWLKGEVKVMYQDSLEFDSEKLKSLTFDFRDIKAIRSAQIINLRARSGRTATGQLFLEGDTATVSGERQASFTRSEILSITAGVPRERNYWTGNLAIDGNLRSGNTDQTDTGIELRFQRRTVLSRLVFDFRSEYTQSNDLQTVDTRSGNFSWDRFWSANLFVRPLFVEYFSDPFQNIASRYTIGTGIGRQLRDTQRTDWSVFAGPAYQSTHFSEVAISELDREDAWALTAGTAFETELTSRIDFLTDYRFQLSKKEAGGYSHRLASSLEFELANSFSFDISAEWNRINNPKQNADGTKPVRDDYSLSFGVGYEF